MDAAHLGFSLTKEVVDKRLLPCLPGFILEAAQADY